MKFRLIVDESKEEEVVVTVHERSTLTDQLEALVMEHTGADRIVAFTEDEMKRLSFSDIECITVLDGKTYAIDTEMGYEDNAKTVCSFFIPGSNALDGSFLGDEIEVSGMYGLAIGNHIAWADPEKHVVYHLTSEDVLGEELLKVAQSISDNS